MSKVAIIGSGITGAITAYLLKQKFPSLNLTILEKGSDAGGRMCTIRSPYDEACTADLGAQYITKSKELTEVQKRCYEELFQSELLKPISAVIEGMQAIHQTSENYVCPKGLGSIAKHFIEKSGCSIHFEQNVVEISPSSTGLQLIAKTETSVAKLFDIIICTMPVPQMLQMNIRVAISKDILNNLSQVKFSSRFALGGFINEAQSLVNYSFAARYISDSPSVRFLSFDHIKRGAYSHTPSLVVHSTKEFGKEHIDDNVDDIAKILMHEAERLLPDVPNFKACKCLKWTFSQVEAPYLHTPGCITLSQMPFFVCGGDSFTKSTFEGCILSAEQIVETIARQIKCTA